MTRPIQSPAELVQGTLDFLAENGGSSSEGAMPLRLAREAWRLALTTSFIRLEEGHFVLTRAGAKRGRELLRQSRVGPRLKDPRRGASDIDRMVGKGLRRIRLLAGMTRGELADLTKISYQQVLKYESGTNRIGATRLWQFSIIFGRPVDSFFGEAGPDGGVANKEPASSFARDETTLLLQAYFSVADRGLRKRLRALVQELAAA